MLAFLCGMSILATALVFLGGAVASQSMTLGLAVGGLGGAWLGVLYGTLIRLASERGR